MCDLHNVAGTTSRTRHGRDKNHVQGWQQRGREWATDKTADETAQHRHCMGHLASLPQQPTQERVGPGDDGCRHGVLVL